MQEQPLKYEATFHFHKRASKWKVTLFQNPKEGQIPGYRFVCAISIVTYPGNLPLPRFPLHGKIQAPKTRTQKDQVYTGGVFTAMWHQEWLSPLTSLAQDPPYRSSVQYLRSQDEGCSCQLTPLQSQPEAKLSLGPRDRNRCTGHSGWQHRLYRTHRKHTGSFVSSS